MSNERKRCSNCGRVYETCACQIACRGYWKTCRCDGHLENREMREDYIKDVAQRIDACTAVGYIHVLANMHREVLLEISRRRRVPFREMCLDYLQGNLDYGTDSSLISVFDRWFGEE